MRLDDPAPVAGFVKAMGESLERVSAPGDPNGHESLLPERRACGCRSTRGPARRSDACRGAVQEVGLVISFERVTARNLYRMHSFEMAVR